MGVEVEDDVAAVETLVEAPTDVVRCGARGRRGMALEHPRR